MILVVGSRFRTKGVDRVIQALAALPAELKAHCRLVIVGHGKVGPFARLAERQGVGQRVHFAGTREDVPCFYRAADVLVHVPRTENTGTVLIEAMICGLPVLVSGNCGFAFHVAKAGAGMVLPEPFDQARCNAALRDFLGSPHRADWALKGPQYCEHTDLYGLIEAAAEVIIARAKRNRRQYAEGS